MKKVKVKLDDARGMVQDLNLNQANKLIPFLQWHAKNLKVTMDKDFQIGDKVAVTTDLKFLTLHTKQGIVTNIGDAKDGIIQIRNTKASKGRLQTFHGSFLTKMI